MQRWRQAWETGGAPGLASKGQAARCRLSGDQLAELDRVLDAGSAAAGLGGPAVDAGPGPGPDQARVRRAVHRPGNLVPAEPTS